MTREDYAELVDYIETRWGTVKSWVNAAAVYGDFEDVPVEAVWESLKLRMTGDPGKARFAPSPPELLASALDWQRARPAPRQLPESTENYGWAEFCERFYGGYVTFAEAVQSASEGRRPAVSDV